MYPLHIHACKPIIPIVGGAGFCTRYTSMLVNQSSLPWVGSLFVVVVVFVFVVFCCCFFGGCPLLWMGSDFVPVTNPRLQTDHHYCGWGRIFFTRYTSMPANRSSLLWVGLPITHPCLQTLGGAGHPTGYTSMPANRPSLL